MTKRTSGHQNGHIFRSGNFWYGRWRRDELIRGDDGELRVERRQHSEKLAEYSDRYRCKKDLKPLLDAKLRPMNDGSSSPESTLSVAAYGDKYFFPYAEREFKPSTTYGYRQYWRMYLKARLSNIALRDFRCVDASNLLTAIHEHHKLGRTTMKHSKALLSSIFRHAKQAGVLDGSNPVTDAAIPRTAAASQPTHAYSPQEVLAMLEALKGNAKKAVALMYFCGLRPGEARAAKWDNYDGKNLRIESSRWRKLETAPKTRDSAATVPVPETLAEILEESRCKSGHILTSPTGKPIDLANLAMRVIGPALARCAECHQEKEGHGDEHEFQPLPQWRGFYALRRGLATLATSIDSQMAAKSLMRHSSILTTAAHYIKSVPADALRAVEKMDALFQKNASGVAPN